MRHALVIGEDPVAASLVEARLWNSGYTSVAHAWSQREAWESIAFRRPNVVVLLAEPGRSPAVDALARMSRATDAPVLVAASGREQAPACIGDDDKLDGPYSIDRLEQAVDAAAPALAA